jgi:hypothetical protein
MDTGTLMASLEHDLDILRAEYVEAGREDEFDAYVNRLRAEGRWPFTGHSRARARRA